LTGKDVTTTPGVVVVEASSTLPGSCVVRARAQGRKGGVRARGGFLGIRSEAEGGDARN
jgi:hypothetical protein